MSDKSMIKYTPMNLDALEEQERKIGFNSTGDYFKFKDGKNTIRILPGMNGVQPFVQYWKHFVKGANDGKAYPHACPSHMAKQPCLTCATATKLSRGTEADAKVADDVKASRRVVANVLDRANPDVGPQVCEFGQKVYGAVKDYMRMMGEDPTDPVNGFDIIVEKTGAGFNTEYKVVAARKSTPLSADPGQADEWLTQAADLSQFVVVPDLREQEERLRGTIIGHMIGSGPQGGPQRGPQRGDRGQQRQRGPQASTSQAMSYDMADDDNSY